MKAGRSAACMAMLLASLLDVSLTGCPLRKQAGIHPPNQAQAPTVTAGQAAMTPPAIAEEQKQTPPPPVQTPAPVIAMTPIPAPPPEPKPKRATPRRKRPAETASAEAAKQEEQAQAAPEQTATATSGASAIGQLTAGDSATGGQARGETEAMIRQTEHGVNGIKRRLSKDDQATVVQIRTFLEQAKQALANGDTDGAHTLAVKAKLLLDELTKK